jgi:hypothetical protein
MIERTVMRRSNILIVAVWAYCLLSSKSTPDLLGHPEFLLILLVGYTDIRRLKTEISSIFKTEYVHYDVGRVLASVRASVASWRTYLREEI